MMKVDAADDDGGNSNDNDELWIDTSLCFLSPTMHGDADILLKVDPAHDENDNGTGE